MRTHLSLAAYLATVGLLLPAGWHALEADIPTDGALTRPPQQTVTIGDAAITIDLDRGLLKSGGALKVSLAGTATAAHEVALDVTVLQDMGMAGERVSRPPRVVERRRLKVPATPTGDQRVEVAFNLGKQEAKGHATSFNVLVTPASKAKVAGIDYEAIGDGRAASATVTTWSGNAFALTIDPPVRPAADQPYVVAVHVKNTTKQPLPYLMVELGAGLNNGLSVASASTDVEIVEITDPGAGADDGTLAPGAERIQRFALKPLHPTAALHVPLFASATSPVGVGGAFESKVVDLPAAIPTEAPAVVAAAPVARN
jgi:hypothetical protein